MRYGILSDIHGNLEALQACLDALSSEKIDGYLCLGDIVGYGANPNECLELVWGLTSEVVAGNHDHAAVGKLDVLSFNHNAAEAAFWTMQRLTRSGGQYLRDLPLTRRYDHLLAVHATPSQPERWLYLLSLENARTEFEAFPDGVTVCVIGHTHTPVVFEWNGVSRSGLRLAQGAYPIREGCRYLVNVGSVGQPRDGDPRAACGIYDTDAAIIEIKRVDYDFASTQKKIRKAGLPDALATRLGVGR